MIKKYSGTMFIKDVFGDSTEQIVNEKIEYYISHQIASDFNLRYSPVKLTTTYDGERMERKYEFEAILISEDELKELQNIKQKYDKLTEIVCGK